MSIKNISQIKQHYHFTDKDAQNLRRLQPIMEQCKEKLADTVYDTMLDFGETVKLLTGEETLRQRKEILAAWFVNLFNGVYDKHYFLGIQRIGQAHAKIKLDPHYRNLSITLVRQFCLNVLEEHFTDPMERIDMIRSLEKILDINLDIISNSYREEELAKFFLSHKLENRLVQLAERFNTGLNLVLVLALMGISVGIIGLFGYDIWKIASGQIEYGIIRILGTLLMLWVMIELMDTEIDYLKNGKFSINIFVEVVMVAVIRDILVGTLKHGDPNRQIVLVGTVLVLGVVFWLISRAEAMKG